MTARESSDMGSTTCRYSKGGVAIVIAPPMPTAKHSQRARTPNSKKKAYQYEPFMTIQNRSRKI